MADTKSMKKEIVEKLSDASIVDAYRKAVNALNDTFLYNGETVNQREWDDKRAALIACDLSGKPLPSFYGSIDVPKLRREIAEFDAAQMAFNAKAERARVELEGGLALDAFNAESRLALERVPSAESIEQPEFPAFATRLEYVQPAQVKPEMFAEHDALMEKLDQLLQEADAVILKNDARRASLSAKAVNDDSLAAKLDDMKAKREALVLAGKDASSLNDKMLELENAIQRDEMRVRCANLDVDVLSRQRVNLQARRDIIQQFKEEVGRRKAALVAVSLTEKIIPLTVKLKQMYEAYTIAKNEAGNGYSIPGIESKIDLGIVLEREEAYMDPQAEETAPAEAGPGEQPGGEPVKPKGTDGTVVITRGRSRWQIG